MSTSRGFFSLTVLLVIVAFVFLATGGYVALKKKVTFNGLMATSTAVTEDQNVSSQTKTLTYTDKLQLIRFEYPSTYTIKYNESWNDAWFQILIDTIPDGKDQLNASIKAEKTNDPSVLKSCYLGLCEAKGTTETIGGTQWIHLSKPLVCSADACPQNDEVYRTSNQGWRYYAIFNTEEEAKRILSTLHFI